LMGDASLSDPVRPRRPLVGATLGDRIWAALCWAGLSKAEACRRIQVTRPALDAWLANTSNPTIDNVRRIVEVTGVTVDEILGVMTGQDPSFPAWREFLATDAGGKMSDGERRMLQCLAWPPGIEPTVIAYHLQLASIQAAKAREY